MALLWILHTTDKSMVNTGRRTACPELVIANWRGTTTSYQSLSPEVLTCAFWKTPSSHFSTTKTALLQKDLTTGVGATKLHPLPTNLGQELQPSLRSLVCSFQTTQLRKDALHVDWQHLLSPLHKSERFAN